MAMSPIPYPAEPVAPAAGQVHDPGNAHGTNRIAHLGGREFIRQVRSSRNRRQIQTGNGMPNYPTQHLNLGIITLDQTVSSI